MECVTLQRMVGFKWRLSVIMLKTPNLITDESSASESADFMLLYKCILIAYSLLYLRTYLFIYLLTYSLTYTNYVKLLKGMSTAVAIS